MTDLATALYQARIDGTVIDASEHDCPQTLEQAYALQGQVMDLFDSPIVGWKLGATNEAAMQMLGLEEPFLGPLLKLHHYQSGAAVRVAPVQSPLLETEFMVTLASDLPPRETPYSGEEVAAAIEYVGASFELVSGRVQGGLASAGLLLMPDGAANHAFVEGTRGGDWREANLSDHPISVQIDGEQVASGSSSALLWGSPQQAVAWLAAHPLVAPRGLRGGDRIMTGTCAGMIPIQPGMRAEADFGALGRVSVEIAG